MAEVIGTVSGVIGVADFAAQIASGIIKAKAFWDEVKEAPDEIKDLMREANFLQSILLDIERYNRRFTFPDYIIDATNVKTSLKQCKEVSLQLDGLVEKLDSQMTSGTRIKRTLAAMNTALKKDQIKKIKSRLKTAVDDVKFAQDRYEREIMINLQLSQLVTSSGTISLDRPNLLTYQSNLALEFMDIQTTQGSPIPDSSCCQIATTNTTLAYQKRALENASIQSNWWVIGCKLLGFIDYETEVHRTERDRSDQRNSESLVMTSQQTRVNIRPPSWITRKAWEAYRRQTYGEWKYIFRAYNVVDEHSPIVRCIRANDIAGIQDLFARKEATPYDKTMEGSSLLRYATRPSELKIISTDLIIFLIDQISSIENILDASNMMISLVALGFWLSDNDFTAVCQHMGMLIYKSNLVDYSNSLLGIFSNFLGATGQFLSATTYLLADYNDYTQAERTQIILDPIDYGICSPYYIWATIKPKHGVLGPEIAQLTHSKNGKTFMHLCSGYLGARFYDLYEKDLSTTRLVMTTSNFHVLPWTYIPEDDTSLLARLLIESGADIHAINNDGRTPMLEVIWSGIYIIQPIANPIYSIPYPLEALQTWLRALKLAGVDLQKYGETEKSLCTAGGVNQEMELWRPWGEEDYGKAPTWRLINFTYGPDVDDWHIWGSEVRDQFAGEFWEMVDHPEWNMPGAWPMEDME